MATYYSPKIVTDGLLICIDPANFRSHTNNRFISYGTGLTTENVSFAINGNGTFQRVAAGTVIGGYTVLPNDVVYSYVLGSDGCHYHGNSSFIPAGAYITFASDYLVTNATNYPVNSALLVIENYGGGAISTALYAPNNLQNVWQRVVITAGPTSSAGTQAMFLYPGYCGTRLANSGTVYFRNPKAEWKSFDTGNVGFNSMGNLITAVDISEYAINGTLYNGTVYDSSNAGCFIFDGIDDFISTNNTLQTASYGVNNLFADNTVAFSVTAWYKFPVSPTQARSDAVNGGNCSYAIAGAGGGIGGAETFNIFVGGTNWGSAYLNNCWVGCRGSKTLISPSAINTNTWNQCVVTWDGTNGAVYHNGIYQRVLNVGGAGLQGNYFTIGSIANGSTAHCFEGSISQVLVHKKSLSAAEILQNYNATKGRFGL